MRWLKRLLKILRDNGKNVLGSKYNANGKLVLRGVKKDLVTLNLFKKRLELGRSSNILNMPCKPSHLASFRIGATTH